MVATAIIGSTVGSAAAGIGSSLIGSSAQQSAANNAAALQQQMFAQTQRNLKPYIQGGGQAFTNLLTAIPGLTQKFNPTMADLAATPGYKFALDQGLQATQNSFAAQGLGQSGAALKGAANYAEGLASTTYQQQFQNYLAQNSQIYNMLAGPAQLGETAAAGQGGISAQVGNNIASNQIGAANAFAGGLVGASNAASGAASNYLQYALLNSMMGGAGGGGGLNTSSIDWSLLGGGR